MTDKQRDDTQQPDRPGRPQRRRYTRPELIEYGSVAKLTRGQAGSQTESGVNFRKSCL